MGFIFSHKKDRMVGNRWGESVLSEENREYKRQQMLGKCFELFVKQGLENTSVNDLTLYCKTYKASFYVYFKSKDEIVVEAAKKYMKTLDTMFKNEFSNPKETIEEALKRGFELVSNQRNELRFIYQVVSSPKYGKKSREEMSEIYSKYFEYSEKFAKIYGIDHEKFRPYFLLFVGTIHDYCLWENENLVREKLDFIINRVRKIGNKTKEGEKWNPEYSNMNRSGENGI